MRIVFIGAVRFSAAMLDVLLDAGAQVVGVCTLSHSSFNADHCDLSGRAHRAGVPVLDAADINSPSSIDWIRRLRPDVVFCLGWSRLIKSELLSLPSLGVIGFHPAALPANRGRHPLIWALALGLDETASTFFFMDEGADSGDIVSQRPVSIAADDDAACLYERITHIASAQLREIVDALASGTVNRREQNSLLSNHWRKRGRLDGQIDWRMGAQSIYNLVRALAAPYPGAHFVYEGEEFKLWKCEIVAEARKNLEPGKVLASSSTELVVKAGSDAIRLLAIEPWPSLRTGDYL